MMLMMMMMNLEECMVGDQGQVADLPLPVLPFWASLSPGVDSLFRSDQSESECYIRVIRAFDSLSK